MSPDVTPSPLPPSLPRRERFRAFLRLLLPLLFALVSGLILALSGWGESFDGQLRAALFRWQSPPTDPSPVTLVALRGASVSSTDGTAAGDSVPAAPVPSAAPPDTSRVGLREALAQLLETLAQTPASARPSAIVVDILLRERTESQAGSGATTRILTAMAQLGTVVLPLTLFYRQSESAPLPSSLDSFRQHLLPSTLGAIVHPTAITWEGPPPEVAPSFYAAAAGLGFFSLSPETQAGQRLERLPMLSPLNPLGSAELVLMPSLSLAGLGVDACGPTPARACVTGDSAGLLVGQVRRHRIPLNERGELLLNYRRRFALTAVSTEVPQVSTLSAPPEVLHFIPGGGSQSLRTVAGVPFPAASLAGQVLLVVDAREPGVFQTPFGPDSPQSTVHAQAMTNVLEHHALRPTSPLLSWVGVGCLLVLVALFRPDRHPRRLSGGSGGDSWRSLLQKLSPPEVRMALLWLPFSVLAQLKGEWVVPMGAPMGALLCAGYGPLLLSTVQKLRELKVLSAAQQELQLLRAELAQKQADLKALEAHSATTQALEPHRLDRATPHVNAPDELASDAQVREPDASTLSEPLVPGPPPEGPASQPGSPTEPKLKSPSKAQESAQPPSPREALAQDIARLQAQEEAVLARVNTQLADVKEHEAQCAEELNALTREQARVKESLRDKAARLELLQQSPRSKPPPGSWLDTSYHEGLYKLTRVLTRDPRLIESLQELLDVAQYGDGPVLILGPPGTGKELVARAVHAVSTRRVHPLIAESCAAIPDGTLQSELFGHEVGAFTGAVRVKIGLVEQADGGVLFLDEIGDGSLQLQTALLRVMQEKTFRRMGGTEQKRSDFRLVTATRQPLSALCEAGKFRDDLYFRLVAGKPIRLTALRERPWDIVPLATHFLTQENQRRMRAPEPRHTPPARGSASRNTAFPLESKPLSFDRGALECLLAHPWPGNVRELQHLVTDYLVPRALAAQARQITAAQVMAGLEGADVPSAPAHSGLLEADAEDDFEPDQAPALPSMPPSLRETPTGPEAELSSPAPSSAEPLTITPAQFRLLLSLRLQHALAALQRADFEYTVAATDRRYRLLKGEASGPVSQGIASRHFCVLRAKALEHSEWRLDRAATLLISIPADERQYAIVYAKLREFVEGQRLRISHVTDPEGLKKLTFQVEQEYSTDHASILALHDALRKGRI